MCPAFVHANSADYSLIPPFREFHRESTTILAFPCCNCPRGGLHPISEESCRRMDQCVAITFQGSIHEMTLASPCELHFMPISESSSKRSMLLWAGLAVLGSMFVLAAPGQQAPAVSVDVNAVNVLVTVRDKHGNIIDSLSQNDFVLEEEGRPQTIRYFSRETDLPLTLGLLIDTASSQRQLLEPERSASGHFIDQVLRENDQDKAFLIHFDSQVELLQDLTTSKQKLNDALDLLQQPQFRRNDETTLLPTERGIPGTRVVRSWAARCYTTQSISPQTR